MKRILAVLLWIAALVCCILLTDKAMMRPDSRLKYERFFAEDEKTQPFDVMFFGTSHVFDGVYPMEIWRDYGIPSYNMGNSSECLELTEWTMRIALQYHKPKVAVVDVYYVGRSLKDTWAYSYRHLFLDAVPLTLTKIQSVTSTFPKKDWMEYLVPFTLYHGRWEEIATGTTQLTMNSVPCMMGAEMRLRTIPADPWQRYTGINEANLSGKDALRRIAKLCEDEGIELLLTAIPSAMNEQEQLDVNSIQLLADELGVPFVNMLDIPELYDFSTDLYDGVSHMNPDGALKVTAYLGRYLDTHYQLEDKRGNPAYADWNDRLAEYEAYYDDSWAHLTLEEKLNMASDGGAED